MLAADLDLTIAVPDGAFGAFIARPRPGHSRLYRRGAGSFLARRPEV
jgi:hypothetical protein